MPKKLKVNYFWQYFCHDSKKNLNFNISPDYCQFCTDTFLSHISSSH